MELLADYALFLAKALTVVFAAGALLVMAAGLARRGSGEPGLTVERLNDHYAQLAQVLRRAAGDRDAWRRVAKVAKSERRSRRRGRAPRRARTYVIDFRGDLRATAVAGLREEVSTIIAVAGDDDDVLVRLENAGGTVHEHGLAASQLGRLRAAGLRVTVAVDKVAASGGYLMAANADRIVAAPFALIGSIGVLAQLPNFHRWLKSRGVDFEMITSGRYKRTLTVFGENTDEGREKLREEVEDVHRLFKDEVARQRETLDIDAVATGEAWYGSRALELRLVDEIATSDELLQGAAEDRDLLLLRYRWKRRLPERLAERADALWTHAADFAATLAQRARLLR